VAAEVALAATVAEADSAAAGVPDGLAPVETLPEGLAATLGVSVAAEVALAATVAEADSAAAGVPDGLAPVETLPEGLAVTLGVSVAAAAADALAEIELERATALAVAEADDDSDTDVDALALGVELAVCEPVLVPELVGLGVLVLVGLRDGVMTRTTRFSTTVVSRSPSG